MTTDPGWKALELSEAAERSRRFETLVALSARLELGLTGLGAREAVATFWTAAGVPDTRLARAKGFWKARLDVAGYIPTSARLFDEPVVTSDGLHFLASARAPLPELPLLVLSVLRYERNRACIFVPLSESPSGSNSLVHEVLSRAMFELGIVDALSHQARQRNVVIIVPVGRFDDRETGLVLTGPATLAGTVPGLRDALR